MYSVHVYMYKYLVLIVVAINDSSGGPVGDDDNDDDDLDSVMVMMELVPCHYYNSLFLFQTHPSICSNGSVHISRKASL